MKHRLKYLIAGMLMLVGLLAPVPVYAQTDPFEQACENANGNSPACNTGGGEDDPIAGEDGALVSIVSILAAVAGIVSVISLIWGGIKYVTSNGDSSSITSAKRAVVAALVGLLIALLARPIVLFVVGKI